MENKNMLQEIRKKKIPDVIKKYEKLIEDIFAAVSKPFPTFENFTNSDGEVTQTSEQQMYAFISVRKSAVDNADRMLLQINELERELYDPTFHDKKENDEDESPPAGNIAKQKAAAKKLNSTPQA